MAIILTETYESLTNSDLVRSAARQLGESERAMAQAITAAGMAILARLSQLAGDSEVMGRVAVLVDVRADGGGTVLASAAAATSAASRLGRGTALLNIAYGPRLQGVVEALAAFAGINQPSARAAVGHAAPLVLKALGERLAESDPGGIGLAPTGLQLADALIRDRAAIEHDAPAVLIAAVDKPVRPAPPIRPSAPVSRESMSSGTRVIARSGTSVAGVTARYEPDGGAWSPRVLIGGLVTLAVLWWLFQPGLYGPYALRTLQTGSVSRVPLTGPGTDAGGSFSSSTSVTPSSRTAPEAVNTLLRFIKRTLPSNKQIDYVEDGVEGRLIQLIENRSQPLQRNQWFEFDRLNFQTGSSNLTPDSRAQVQNIADILNSYPNAKIKIGGYTDNVGDPVSNQRLSEARAQRVMTELITLGISALRLEAEGYGEQHPIADNSTSEGRARNRRTAVRVLER